eukprot:CAMPEP_0198154010 /NCGR_PEP_ID=MMETSP1443-20131203/66814_1 /TAXON_ID=186043 /ORGANISM="Entomoneis sp., Strain CCMP2396" /LENGTH=164 /DNA_ID=CAMNT_0043820575 /DNA_START=69 /DNA_END=563 /DNA_ORIENTATION=+
MVLGIAWLFGSSVPKEWPEGRPVKLPNYFPVQPKGCDKQSQQLFECVANAATEKQRDMEKAGLHKSAIAGVETKALDEKYGAYIQEQLQQPTTKGEADATATLPRPGDNPLDECKMDILKYQHCCDKALKKKNNWILTEPFRVQSEYRYDAAKSQAPAAGAENK